MYIKRKKKETTMLTPVCDLHISNTWTNNKINRTRLCDTATLRKAMIPTTQTKSGETILTRPPDGEKILQLVTPMFHSTPEHNMYTEIDQLFHLDFDLIKTKTYFNQLYADILSIKHRRDERVQLLENKYMTSGDKIIIQQSIVRNNDKISDKTKYITYFYKAIMDVKITKSKISTILTEDITNYQLDNTIVVQNEIYLNTISTIEKMLTDIESVVELKKPN